MITEIEKKLRREMFAYLQQKYPGVRPPDRSIQQMLDTAYSFVQAERQLQELNSYAKPSPKMNLLDVGCGFGYFVSLMLKKGYSCQGYEVDRQLFVIAQKLLKINQQDAKKIKFIKEKKLPYQDNTFDFINLHYVLDYVTDVPGLLSELKRILKDRGQIFIISPNYQCCYSPVYMMFFIPWLPKWLNRIYFKLMRRPNTKFLESLTFITPRYCEGIFKTFGFEIHNLGLSAWDQLIAGEKFEDRSRFLIFLVRKIHQLRLFWLLKFLSRFGFYTPLAYLLKKNH